MAWQSPMTAVANEVLTAQQWNAEIRDNMNESMAAKAVKAGGWFIADDEFSVAQRSPAADYVQPNESVTSGTGYQDLTTAGPIVRIDTSARGALMFLSVRMHFTSAGDVGRAAIQFTPDGGVAEGLGDSFSVGYLSDANNARIRIGIMQRSEFSDRPGEFRIMYAGTGTGTITFSHRRLVIIGTK